MSLPLSLYCICVASELQVDRVSEKKSVKKQKDPPPRWKIFHFGRSKESKRQQKDTKSHPEENQPMVAAGSFSFLPFIIVLYPLQTAAVALLGTVSQYL